MCHVLKVSRSGFYAWAERKPSKRTEKQIALNEAISDVFEEHKGRLGSPKMHRELAERAVFAGKNQVAQAMHNLGLRAKTHKKFKVTTTDSKHNLPVAQNLLNRNFTVDAPNKVLVSDITYVKTGVGWAYLTVFIDLYSRAVVGWDVSDNMGTDTVLTALRRAIKNRGLQGTGVMIHSDRGSQYASDAFRRVLKWCGFVQSMSRKGNCWDNAVAESFFRIYKTELAYHCQFTDVVDVWRKTFEYIECYYNRKRKHGSINFLTPVMADEYFIENVA